MVIHSRKNKNTHQNGKNYLTISYLRILLKSKSHNINYSCKYSYPGQTFDAILKKTGIVPFVTFLSRI